MKRTLNSILTSIKEAAILRVQPVMVTPRYIEADVLYGKVEPIDEDTLQGWSEHQTRSGRSYRYAFVKRPDGHIDIAIQTPQTGRSEDYVITHKKPLEGNSEGVAKICIRREETVRDSGKAYGIMKEYTELYDTYIRTGKTISEQLDE